MTVIVLVVFISGSLVLANALPANTYDIQSGVVEVFLVMGHQLGWSSDIARLLAFGMFLGVIGAVNSWIPGPSKGLLASAHDGTLPPFLHRTSTS